MAGSLTTAPWVPPGVKVTGQGEVRSDPGPDLSPPYYDADGNPLTTYKEIREYQNARVCEYVEDEIKRTWTGRPLTEWSLEDMRRDVVSRLMQQRALGNLDPNAPVWNWVDASCNKIAWADRHVDEWGVRFLAHAEQVQDLINNDPDRNLEWNGTIWVPDPKTRAKDRMLKRLRPTLLNHNGKPVRALSANFRNTKENEIVALRLLRDMVEPEVFRKYLKSGFVNVTGPSGLVYQIVRNSHLISVWDQGVRLCTLCVYLQNHVPPTDDVVAKMVICELDEADIWKRANVRWKVPSTQGENHPKVLKLRAA